MQEATNSFSLNEPDDAYFRILHGSVGSAACREACDEVRCTVPCAVDAFLTAQHNDSASLIRTIPHTREMLSEYHEVYTEQTPVSSFGC